MLTIHSQESKNDRGKDEVEILLDIDKVLTVDALVSLQDMTGS